MHTALISKDGEKMSKSLGNLVFVDALRKEWDPTAIRLAIIEHHYRTEWEWDDELMPRNGRAARGVARRRRTVAPGDVLDEVRERARRRPRHAGRGRRDRRRRRAGASDVAAAAALLGVLLDSGRLTTAGHETVHVAVHEASCRSLRHSRGVPDAA